MPTRRLHPWLRPHVRSIVGYHDVMDRRMVHHGLPSPELTVVLAFDEPLDAGWLAEPDRSDRYWACAGAEEVSLADHGADATAPAPRPRDTSSQRYRSNRIIRIEPSARLFA